MTSHNVRTTLNDAMDLMAILNERGCQVAQRAARAINFEIKHGLSDEGARRLFAALADCVRYQNEAEDCARRVCAGLDEMARFTKSAETNGLVLR